MQSCCTDFPSSQSSSTSSTSSFNFGAHPILLRHHLYPPPPTISTYIPLSSNCVSSHPQSCRNLAISFNDYYKNIIFINKLIYQHS